MSLRKSHCVDVAIVGAGPAGAALAILLARANHSVQLIERSEFDRPRVGESLSPSVTPLLRELGVWKTFKELDTVPSYGVRSIWGTGTLKTHSHLQNICGQGWHVDRRCMDAMLAKEASNVGVFVNYGTVIDNIEYQSNMWELNLHKKHIPSSTQSVTAKLLVDATGRNAQVGTRLGAKRLIFDRLVGVHASFDYDAGHGEHHVLVETCEHGWWYSAPVSSSKMIAMLMTDSDLCSASRLSVVRRWDEYLAQTSATHARLDGTQQLINISKPSVIPAVSQRLCRNQDHRPWIAVGDASLAVDPISGSGVLYALQSALRGADCVKKTLIYKTKKPIESYETECDRHCTEYLQKRARYYGMEQRFGNKPFWTRRSLDWYRAA